MFNRNTRFHVLANVALACVIAVSTASASAADKKPKKSSASATTKSGTADSGLSPGSVAVTNDVSKCMTVKIERVHEHEQMILAAATLNANEGSENCGCTEGEFSWRTTREGAGPSAAGSIRDPFLTNGNGNPRAYTFVIETDRMIQRPAKFALQIGCSPKKS